MVPSIRAVTCGWKAIGPEGTDTSPDVCTYSDMSPKRKDDLPDATAPATSMSSPSAGSKFTPERNGFSGVTVSPTSTGGNTKVASKHFKGPSTASPSCRSGNLKNFSIRSARIVRSFQAGMLLRMPIKLGPIVANKTCAMRPVSRLTACPRTKTVQKYTTRRIVVSTWAKKAPTEPIMADLMPSSKIFSRLAFKGSPARSSQP
mmetsp:Transcript_26436/g.57656  ORF Transcript_26436/g.57656 Transcript_26436/m.57656 type:complete len:203 (-) Transcript_26436:1018-1626(-)